MRGALINAASICCLLRSLPVVSFVSSPPVYSKSSGVVHVRAGPNAAVETTHFSSCWRGGEGDARQRHRAAFRQQHRLFRADVPLESSRGRDDFVSGEIQSHEEFEAWKAAAADAQRASGDGSSPGNATAAVPIEQVYSARASPAGIGWVAVFGTVLEQLLFLGLFALLAAPATRTQVQSLLVFRPSDVALGALAAAPMFVYGIWLGTQHWPWFQTLRRKPMKTDIQQREYFGKQEQVAKVAAVSIALAVLVGFCEELVYRGFFPLLLAAKTGLPPAAIVGLSAVFCGAGHAGTLGNDIDALGNAIDAAVLAVYVHCLLLSTGNLLVPITAHAVYNVTLLVAAHAIVAEHANDTTPQQQE